MSITEQDKDVWKVLYEACAQVVDVSSQQRVDALCHYLVERLAPVAGLPFRARIASIADTNVARLEILSGHPEKARIVRILPAGRDARLQNAWQEDDLWLCRVQLPALAENSRLQLGDILCDAEMPAAQSDMFSLNVLWLGEEPLYAGRTYRVQTPAGEFSALVGRLKNRIDPNSGLALAARNLKHGEMGQVEIELDGNFVFDTQDVPTPLAFIQFRHETNDEVAGLGVIRFALRRASNIRWQPLELNKQQRAAALGQKPLVLWFTGLSGCGKSTVASLLEQRLHELGKHTYLLDGDNVRHGLCKDLGFTKADRVENMRRVTEVAKLMVDAGLIVLVTFISPFREERAKARASFEEGEFVEIFVDTPLEICEARDVKGLYAKARAGLIRNFTGIDSPYEPPESPEIRLDGASMSTRDMVEEITSWLHSRNLL